ncbi:bifunctional 23S rRNA (guanine(2069)-N(7))-methyltransferase RlmK/23S rRNA (guanine(2445)-N(2))-methyltransferase RlmL [Planctomycetaceae bacterium SH139]
MQPSSPPSDSSAPPSATFDLLATCGFGLEKLICYELSTLGYEGRVVSPGFVAFKGTAEAVCRANIWLRTADRVLIQLAQFPAADFDALFEGAKRAAWEHWIGALDAIHVTAHSVRSQLHSVPAIQRAVKRAIVDRLCQVLQVDALPETETAYEARVALIADQAWLTLDTTGPSLHRRGYRLKYRRDDLKESMAAGIVMLSRWNREQPLLDPFCGSGTILIEAAMIGRRLAPGLHRTFAAESWPTVPSEVWDQIRQAAASAALDDLPDRIVGVDTNVPALRQAREDAARAGVENSVHFQPKSFTDLTSRRRGGWVITTPPWATAGRESTQILEQLPVVLRTLKTWSHAILSDVKSLEKVFGRRADRRRKLYNDRRQCMLYTFVVPADQPNTEEQPLAEGQPRAVNQQRAAFGNLTEKAYEQAGLFERRLIKRAKHFRRWPTRQGISCFRLYDRDIPEIPLVVDRYDQYLHITEYERPHDRDPATHANWLDLMVATAGKTLQIPHQHVFFKSRQRQRGSTQHERVAQQRNEVQVTEGGLNFWVNLSDYVDTGLFLDHRITRGMVRDEAAGKRMVNLFAYTGSFSVYAAHGGAIETTTVDLSPTYLEWAQRNLSSNGFTGDNHRVVRADTLSFLTNLPRKPLYDLAVVDPPTFSNSKKTDQDWEVQSGYIAVLNELMLRMFSGGVIYFSNNFRRFKFAEELIQAQSIHEISNQTVPADYRNRRIHRCWRIIAR